MVTLAKGGKVMLLIAIGTDATEREKAAADTLTEYLERVSGTTFTVKAGGDRAGIAW